MRRTDDVTQWARRQFAAARLGDLQRVQPLVMMAEQAARMPAGLLSEVFGNSSGGPHGTITIGRGLQRIRDAAALLEQIERERTPR